MSKLRVLVLCQNRGITSISCKMISFLSDLEELNLARTSVGDRGVKDLLPLKNLVHLNVSDTNSSRMAVLQLQENLPRLLHANA